VWKPITNRVGCEQRGLRGQPETVERRRPWPYTAFPASQAVIAPRPSSRMKNFTVPNATTTSTMATHPAGNPIYGLGLS
jgi:hypothetical protein